MAIAIQFSGLLWITDLTFSTHLIELKYYKGRILFNHLTIYFMKKEIKQGHVLCPKCASSGFEMRTDSRIFFEATKDDDDTIADEQGTEYDTKFYCVDCKRECSDIFDTSEISWN